MTSTAFENRATAELSSGGMFALWCLRKRVQCLKRDESPNARLDYGFELAGIPEALGDFEVVFDWLARTALRPIQLGCPKCGQVSRDEGLLLAAFAAFQRGDSTSGEILLRCFLPRVPSLHAAAAAAKFARALAQAELPVDLAVSGGDPTGRHGWRDAAGGPGTAVPGSASVH
jgi:hypothetical protein